MRDAASQLSPGPHGARFLHIIPDNKFIDEARGIFEEAAPGTHDYLLLAPPAALRYIHSFQPIRCWPDDALRPDVLDRLPEYAGVFIHFLSPAARQVVARAPAGTNFIWLGWGGDYYHLIRERSQLLLPATRAMLSNMPGRASSATQFVRNLLHAIHRDRLLHTMGRAASLMRLRRIGPGKPGEAVLLARFSLFAPVLEEDYHAVAARNPGFSPRFARWNYLTPGLEQASKAPVRAVNGHNVLLGNSATAENNHLEVLQSLQGALGPSRKIICPLSYGDADYARAIANAGQRSFGAQFVPLLDFTDAASYVEILRSCSVVAMNHLRQQAMGNIITMLWLGAHVFLHRENPINASMRRIGVHLHDIRKLPEFMQGDEPRRTDQALAEVRERLMHRFSRATILAQTHMLLTQVRNGPISDNGKHDSAS